MFRTYGQCRGLTNTSRSCGTSPHVSTSICKPSALAAHLEHFIFLKSGSGGVWDVKEEVEDVDSNIPENRPEEVDGEVKIEVKERTRMMMMKRMLIIFANSVELYFRVRLL